MNKPNKIILHHTGGTDANPLADTSHHTLEIIKNGHVARGFTDVGYNWVIEKTGKVRKGRDETKDGAHTLGQNSQSIGICIVGNFDATYPTKEQEDALVGLLGQTMKKYSLTPEDVHYHREYANKTCPGRNISATWGKDLAEKFGKEVKDTSEKAEQLILKETAPKQLTTKQLIIKLLEYIIDFLKK